MHDELKRQNIELANKLEKCQFELSQSQEQQAATASVLKTISEFSGDLSLVFSPILQSATRLCDAAFGVLFRSDGDWLEAAATIGVPQKYSEFMQNRGRFRPHEGAPLYRVLTSKAPVYTADDMAESHPGPAARYGGARSLIAVPMLNGLTIIGALVIYRTEVRPFDPVQTQLVASFANQAVIAIENARLFNEVQARTRELTASLNELHSAQDRLVQTEKLASLGQLTAGIAHEIKNPLNFVNNFAALSADLTVELKELLAAPEISAKLREEVDELTDLLKGNLEKVVQHGKRADSIVKNMLLHSRESSGEHRSTDINALVEEALNLAYHGARAERPAFEISLLRDLDPDAGIVELYPQEITRALLNLISNGFYAATKRRSEAAIENFEPALRVKTRNLGSRVEIRIRDNGTGIPPEVRAKIFNPFFTTKPTGEGTGLGLSMSHDIIVKQHSGTIEVETELGVSTEFILTLPRSTTSPL